jgi:nucleotide-binding universal stress UspA family protein
MKILIAYDGSADAKAAVAWAGSLFDGSIAVVLNVWEGFTEVVDRSGAGLPSALDFEEIDAACEHAAHECALEGSGHARVAGLPAEARCAKRGATIWETILEQAAETDADVIVVGSRGRGTIQSLLLGSVSRALLRHADRPVLVVPASDVAAKRSAPRPLHRKPVDREFFSARL